MIDFLSSAAPIAERSGVTPDVFASEIVPAYRPVVLRGLATDWPAVAAGQGGVRPMIDYLRQFDAGRPVTMFAGAPDIAGRFFYSADHRGMNFQQAQVLLSLVLDALAAEAGNPAAPSLYVGSTPTPDVFPGWAEANVLSLPTPGAVPRLWIGNGSRVSTLYDMSSNLAVVVSGRRRFAVIPPAQTPDLYVGPLEDTIAGQPVSMVDLEAPDLDRYPRFAEAMPAVRVAELGPGDAIYIPAYWWHDVRATGPLNVLVNYWWHEGSGASPFNALMHAVLAVRDLPAGERDAMRVWFDQYVFGPSAASVADHLPDHARGVVGPASPERDAKIRAFLRQALADR